MVSRQTCFPLVTDKVQKYLSDFLGPTINNNEMWLEYKGIPLKWFKIYLAEIFIDYFLTFFF